MVIMVTNTDQAWSVVHLDTFLMQRVSGAGVERIQLMVSFAVVNGTTAMLQKNIPYFFFREIKFAKFQLYEAQGFNHIFQPVLLVWA